MGSKPIYTYKSKDTFYDIETFINLFTNVEYYPKDNYAIFSYLQDTNLIMSEADRKYIENVVYKTIPQFTGVIFWEDLSKTGSYTRGIPGMQTFAKRFGLACKDTYINNETRLRGLYPADYYPVKQTDIDYNADEHGIRFGYNTTNYDITMLSKMFTMVKNNMGVQYLTTDNPQQKIDLNASEIRKFNDILFTDQYIDSMPQALAMIKSIEYEIPKWTRNYQTDEWILRKAYLLTNRYIDVARLNEKQQRVALKRLMGMLGLPIIESEKTGNDNYIEDLEQAAEQFAYNLSDTFNLRILFEHKTYQTAYHQKTQMLQQFPESVYEKENDHTYKAAMTNKHIKVRKNRLTSDSSSAKFAENVISPYSRMQDSQYVSFDYPDAKVAERLSRELGYTITPTNVLEDTKKFFIENVAQPGTQAYKAFEEVYNFYKSIEGKNFNQSEYYKELYGDDIPTYDSNSYVKKLMNEYNTNLFYFDAKGNPTTCFVTFSIGGIHGQEIKLDKFIKEYQTYQKNIKIQQYIKDKFDNDPLKAINSKPTITTDDGQEITIKNVLKSGSTKTKASWKTYKEPSLFVKNSNTGVYELHKKYKYVSDGKANHEDFTSYYPLLLAMLAVFRNENWGIDPETNEAIDRYFQLFKDRVEKKNQAKDYTLDEITRETANLIQTLLKLVLNAASGAADPTFDNNIRMNNKIISMRSIGQMFAWRIGQAQTLAGARVPSTNTDGLYTMDISEEENNRILSHISKDMYVEIEPEVIHRFISKDSNNRLEWKDKRTIKQNGNVVELPATIVSAKGGTLTSWSGPTPEQSLNHPAAIDYALAHYLINHPDPTNSKFDIELGKQMFAQLINEHTPQDALLFFQWIVSSNPRKHRYVFKQCTNNHTGDIVETKTLQHYNRIFLTKNNQTIKTEIQMANPRVVTPASAAKRNREQIASPILNPLAVKIMKDNNFDIINDQNYMNHDAQITKISGLPEKQNVSIINEGIKYYTDEQCYDLFNKLDTNAYLFMLQHTLIHNWSNLEGAAQKKAYTLTLNN